MSSASSTRTRRHGPSSVFSAAHTSFGTARKQGWNSPRHPRPPRSDSADPTTAPLTIPPPRPAPATSTTRQPRPYLGSYRYWPGGRLPAGCGDEECANCSGPSRSPHRRAGYVAVSAAGTCHSDPHLLHARPVTPPSDQESTNSVHGLGRVFIDGRPGHSPRLATTHPLRRESKGCGRLSVDGLRAAHHRFRRDRELEAGPGRTDASRRKASPSR